MAALHQTRRSLKMTKRATFYQISNRLSFKYTIFERRCQTRKDFDNGNSSESNPYRSRRHTHNRSYSTWRLSLRVVSKHLDPNHDAEQFSVNDVKLETDSTPAPTSPAPEPTPAPTPEAPTPEATADDIGDRLTDLLKRSTDKYFPDRHFEYPLLYDPTGQTDHGGCEY